MSKFKKILLIIPLIGCLIVSLVPFGSFGASIGDYFDTPDYSSVPSGANPWYSLSDCGFSADSSDPYFLYYFSSSSFQNSHTFYTLFISSDKFECENSGSDMIVTFSNYIYLKKGSRRYIDNEDYSAGRSPESSSSVSDVCRIYSFKYNVETHDLTLYGDANFGSPFTISGGFHGVQTTYFESDPNALDVEVTFNPALSGEIDRRYENDGKLYFNDSFKMTIKNNSQKAIQYRFTIDNPFANTDDVNASLGFEGDNSLDISIDDVLNPWYKIEVDGSIVDNGTALELLKKYYNDKYTYRYFTKEWCYSVDPSSEDKFSNSVGSLQYKSTEWHYLQSGQEFTQIFNWNQINLVTKKSYDVIVEAVATDLNYAADKWEQQSKIDNGGSGGGGTHGSGGGLHRDFVISRENIQEVYRSTFYLNEFSGVQYDPTDCSNGIMPYSDISDISHYKMSYDAVQSLDGSHFDYTSKDFYIDSDSWFNKGGFNVYNNSLDLDISNSVNRLFSTSSGFIGFIGNVFSILPFDVSMLIFLGFVAIISIGIIKGIRG